MGADHQDIPSRMVAGPGSSPDPQPALARLAAAFAAVAEHHGIATARAAVATLNAVPGVGGTSGTSGTGASGNPGRIGRIIFAVTGGKPVSKKIISQAFVQLLSYAGAYVIGRYQFHLDALDTQAMSGAIAVVAGLLAGYIAKEEGLHG